MILLEWVKPEGNYGICNQKEQKKSSPKEIGRELVTLFKNYFSEINFEAYILFLGGVTSSFRVDDSKNVFGIDNVKKDAIDNLKEGLIDECVIKKCEYPSDNPIQ